VTLPARFPARRLLKGVSIFLGILVFGLYAAILIIPVVRGDGHAAEVAMVTGPLMLLPGLYVVNKLMESFSVLEIDERGVRVRRWVGGPDLRWERIESVRYWEEIQHVHGSSREWFVELRGQDGRRLLRLKSTYEREAYACLLDAAKARNIRIDQ
jgi:hypothetical protein